MKKRIKISTVKKKYQKIKNKGLSWISILVVIGFLSLVLGGFAYISSTPRSNNTNNYVLLPEEGCTDGENLHLCTFRILTVTPTPRPTDSPDNDNNDDGGSNGGNPGGDPEPPDNGGGAPAL